MKLPSVDYSRPVENLAQGPAAINAPVQKFMQQAKLSGEVSGLVTQALLKQDEREAQNLLIEARTRAEQLTKNITLNRTLNQSDFPGSADVFNFMAEQRTSAIGPAVFESESKLLKDEFKSRVPASMRDAFDKNFDSITHQAMGRVFVQSQTYSQDEQLADFKTNVDKLMQNNLYKEAKSFVQGSTAISEEKKVDLAKKIDIEAESDIYKNNMLSKNVKAMTENINHLNSPEYKGHLDEGQRLATAAAIKGRIAEIKADFDAANALNHGAILGDLERKVRLGGAGPMEIEKAYRGQLGMTPAKRTELLVIFDNLQKEKAGKAKNINMVHQSILNGQTLDRKNPEQKIAVKDYFDYMLENNRDPAQLPTIIMNTVRTGIIPLKLQSMIRAADRSENLAQMDQAAEIYRIVEQHAPQALGDVGDLDRTAVASYVAMVDSAALTPGDTAEELRIKKQAFAIARENVSRTDEERELLKTQYAKLQLEGGANNREALLDHIKSSNITNPANFWGPSAGGLTGGLLAPPPDITKQANYSRLMTHYDALVKSYYSYTKNIEVAQSLAFKRLVTGKGWGRSSVNGNVQLMEWPPEKALGLPASIIREQFDRDMTKKLTDMNIWDIKPKDLIITSAGDYTRQTNQWTVMYLDKNGEPQPLWASIGKMFTWTMNASKFREHVEAQQLQKGKDLRMKMEERELNRLDFIEGQ